MIDLKGTGTLSMFIGSRKAAKYNQSWIYIYMDIYPSIPNTKYGDGTLLEIPLKYAYEDISPFSWNVRPSPFTLVCNP